MNAIDGTEHYEGTSETPPPSLLVIVLDTNLHAWSTLSSTLPLSKAVANLLVFINAHLAFNNANRVAVIASHCQRTKWLYPSSPTSHGAINGKASSPKSKKELLEAANKYRPFALIEEEVLCNLRQLMDTTTTAELESTNTTLMAGALTLALSYINKTTASMTNPNPNAISSSNTAGGGVPDSRNPVANPNNAVLNSRILILSTSGDLASQYIPIMNLIFAAQHSRIPIDILKLTGDTVLLQQASYTTSGIFLSAGPTAGSSTSGSSSTAGNAGTNGANNSITGSMPSTLLPHLLFGLLPDAAARQHLIPPTAANVDFRAACFCHRRVVDIGFVCSICLSIFCEILAGGICLTCSTKLSVKSLAGPVVLEPKKKKKKLGQQQRREEVTDSSPAAAAAATTNSPTTTPVP